MVQMLIQTEQVPNTIVGFLLFVIDAELLNSAIHQLFIKAFLFHFLESVKYQLIYLLECLFSRRDISHSNREDALSTRMMVIASPRGELRG